MTELIMLAIIYVAACAYGGIYVAEQKNRSLCEGLIFGVLLGPVGMLVVACLPTRVSASVIKSSWQEAVQARDMERWEKEPQVGITDEEILETISATRK